MAEATLTSRRVIKQGMLLKRCRWCWRPRFIEITSDPPDVSGPQYTFYLLIYEQSHRAVKNKIRIEDIVTIRSGKQNRFHIYLNNGMFLFFRAESTDSKSAWMAELKMALGKGNLFHVQVNTPSNNFVLDHALLYCVGVNLPSHQFGQLDRVLVVASPINDVNFHAWNLNRVVCFIVLEAGIQMELCGECMGHRKNTVTFLLSPEFLGDCMNFLLKEIRVADEPVHVIPNGPLMYKVPHKCIKLNRHPSLSSNTSPYYITLAERVIMDNGRSDIGIGTDPRSRLYSNLSQSSTSSTSPIIPPRDIPREDVDIKEPEPYLQYQSRTNFNARGTTEHDQSCFETPYHISHRIYITDSGITREPHILGSGSGEFRHRTRSPHAPPRFDSPLYADTNKTFYTSEAPIPPPRPPRPDFIGRRAPVLPPRGIRLSTYLKATNTVSGSCIQSSRDEDNLSCTIGELGNDSNQKNEFVDPNNPPPIPVKTEKSFLLTSDSISPTNRSPTPSLCTDDITNADFECITKLKFTKYSNRPPPIPPRSKRPVPVPQKPVPTPQKSVPIPSSSVHGVQNDECQNSEVSENLEKTSSICSIPNQCIEQLTTIAFNSKYPEEDGALYTYNPMYEMTKIVQSSNCGNNSPVLQKRWSSLSRMRSQSLSSSSLSSNGHRKCTSDISLTNGISDEN